MKMQIVLSVATLAVVAPSFGETTVTTNETGIVYDIASWQKASEHETTTARLAWPGKSLSDIVAVKGTMCGAWIGGDYSADGLIYDRTETSMKVQFQCVDTAWGKISKVVRAELAETAEGVTIKLTGAMVMTASIGQLQPDDTFSKSSTPIGSTGYGVKNVEAYGDVYEVSEFPQPPSGGIMVTGGTLRVNVSADVDSSAAVSGNGRLWLAAGAASAGRKVAYAPALPANSSWVTVLTEADLKDVTLTGGMFGGGWVEGTVPCTPYNAATQSDGSVIVQLQRLSWGASRCVRVQLRQDGANVQVKGVDSYGISGDHLGEDATKWEKSTGFSGGGYIISNLTFSRNDRFGVTLRGTKTWAGGTKVDGVRLNILSSIMPDNSVVKVTDGGILKLSAENAYDHYPRNTYDLAAGTLLVVDAFDAVNCGDKVIADAASVKVSSEHRAYLNDLTLKNGATVSGNTFRVGNAEPVVWRTSGTGPIVIASSVETVCHKTDAFTFDVGTDLTLNGNVFEFSGREGMPLVKTGGGKLTFNGNVTCSGAGTLTLGGGSVVAIPVTKPMTAAAGLVLADNSSLEIAAGKVAKFGNSSKIAWADGKTLTLSGAFSEADQTMQFGASADGLTAAQLKAIHIGTWKAYLDDAGWLHGRQPGLSVFVR